MHFQLLTLNFAPFSIDKPPPGPLRLTSANNAAQEAQSTGFAIACRHLDTHPGSMRAHAIWRQFRGITGDMRVDEYESTPCRWDYLWNQRLSNRRRISRPALSKNLYFFPALSDTARRIACETIGRRRFRTTKDDYFSLEGWPFSGRCDRP